MDGALAVVLLISGIVVATSDYVQQCDWLKGGIKCSSLTAGVVLTSMKYA